MNASARSERLERAAAEAAEWLAHLRAAPLSPAQRVEFADWLRDAPMNVAALLRMADVPEALDGFHGWDAFPAADFQAADNVVDLPGRVPAPRAAGRAGLVRSPRRWAVGASMCALALLAGLALWTHQAMTTTTLRTAAGERREVTLADGSVVNIAPASELQVRFRPQERDLRLVRGEAFFHVSKDPRRPFIVATNGARVRAVGTAFSVRHDEASTVVTVVEGRVSISPADGPRSAPAGSDVAPPAPVLLGANQQLHIRPDGSAQPVRQVNGALEVAWTAGELIFDDEPLLEVVAHFNAYNRVQIIITDPALAARRVSGVFRASDPESFVAFVESVAPTPPSRRDGGHIYLGTDGGPPAGHAPSYPPESH